MNIHHSCDFGSVFDVYVHGELVLCMVHGAPNTSCFCQTGVLGRIKAAKGMRRVKASRLRRKNEEEEEEEAFTAYARWTGIKMVLQRQKNVRKNQRSVGNPFTLNAGIRSISPAMPAGLVQIGWHFRCRPDPSCCWPLYRADSLEFREGNILLYSSLLQPTHVCNKVMQARSVRKARTKIDRSSCGLCVM